MGRRDLRLIQHNRTRNLRGCASLKRRSGRLSVRCGPILFAKRIEQGGKKTGLGRIYLFLLLLSFPYCYLFCRALSERRALWSDFERRRAVPTRRLLNGGLQGGGGGQWFDSEHRSYRSYAAEAQRRWGGRNGLCASGYGRDIGSGCGSRC